MELAKEARGRRREVPKEGEQETEDPLKIIRNEGSPKSSPIKIKKSQSEQATRPNESEALNEAEEAFLLDQPRDEQAEEESDISKSLFEDFEMEE